MGLLLLLLLLLSPLLEACDAAGATGVPERGRALSVAPALAWKRVAGVRCICWLDVARRRCDMVRGWGACEHVSGAMVEWVDVAFANGWLR